MGRGGESHQGPLTFGGDFLGWPHLPPCGEPPKSGLCPGESSFLWAAPGRGDGNRDDVSTGMQSGDVHLGSGGGALAGGSRGDAEVGPGKGGREQVLGGGTPSQEPSLGGDRATHPGGGGAGTPTPLHPCPSPTRGTPPPARSVKGRSCTGLYEVNRAARGWNVLNRPKPAWVCEHPCLLPSCPSRAPQGSRTSWNSADSHFPGPGEGWSGQWCHPTVRR